MYILVCVCVCVCMRVYVRVFYIQVVGLVRIRRAQHPPDSRIIQISVNLCACIRVCVCARVLYSGGGPSSSTPRSTSM